MKASNYQLDQAIVMSATRLSFNMICSNPPCICSQPSEYDDSFCEKRSPWEPGNFDNELIYSSPVLFFGANPELVGACGWVFTRPRATSNYG